MRIDIEGLHKQNGDRFHLRVPALADALTGAGAASIGWDAGRIEAGGLADLVTVGLDSVRLAQQGPDRVEVTGACGEPPPRRLKVGVNELGGWRNGVELVLTRLHASARLTLHAQDAGEYILFDGEERTVAAELPRPSIDVRVLLPVLSDPAGGRPRVGAGIGGAARGSSVRASASSRTSPGACSGGAWCARARPSGPAGCGVSPRMWDLG